jgi:formylmethanofuran dehydrogenase subunit C
MAEGKAVISCNATVMMKIEEPATTMVLDGTQNTLVTTDLSTGFILNMKVEGFSEGYSTLAQMNGQKIPTTITSLVTYELIQ